METLLVTVHYIICVVLIILVLLQAGKGASIGATFGGGSSQTLFGARGAATFLTKVTTVLALAFLCTSIWLAQISRDKTIGSVLDKVPVEMPAEMPVEDVAVPEEKGPPTEDNKKE
ncbi:MAG: preprotein translocase subunit SecG [Deltaproteobacteria bacterium RIFCSPLOWO2_02_FULL_50_16]|nr:MAG: preprotein translocase subunit SecG [Deltaproteobacteria bacterium GWA2_50_8]OGQ26767.1 MAG: preprotein translocase subunit SecG [Deltaproteobacteria bacterium RIFCSPHIGHO2_02_FULL_50_15]OGQ57048.1 MAG: preprotein translocase subunit SecG [Deltaproteobacteria bacterium RIFCSPLOWO2_02_FULL_50_16]OGQ66886.1 MAG: preprotein translocase subunit SecG [Deltaproteobacteria bacterium RIFCSPLOWO2_12_FULL_50_11]